MIQQHVRRMVYLCAPLGLSLVATIGLAQTQAAAGKIFGTVKVVSDTSTVAGASVELIGTGRRTVTDEAGVFTFDSVASGMREMQVRKLGYAPAAASVEVSSQKRSVILIRLSPVPARYVEVELRGEKVLVPARFEEAYYRADTYFGTLITEQEIRERNAPDTKTLLARVRDVQVTDRGVVFVRCSNNPSALSPVTRSSGFGKVEVYFNGMHKITGTVGTGAVNDVLRSIPPANIELIEVYSGVGRVPAEFLTEACAVVVLWTKKP